MLICSVKELIKKQPQWQGFSRIYLLHDDTALAIFECVLGTCYHYGSDRVTTTITIAYHYGSLIIL